jgi:hypothetical protein
LCCWTAFAMPPPSTAIVLAMMHTGTRPPCTSANQTAVYICALDQTAMYFCEPDRHVHLRTRPDRHVLLRTRPPCTSAHWTRPPCTSADQTTVYFCALDQTAMYFYGPDRRVLLRTGPDRHVPLRTGQERHAPLRSVHCRRALLRIGPDHQVNTTVTMCRRRKHAAYVCIVFGNCCCPHRATAIRRPPWSSCTATSASCPRCTPPSVAITLAMAYSAGSNRCLPRSPGKH